MTIADPQKNLILIIDDSATMQLFLSDMMKDFGEIMCASSGVEGIEFARQHHPQIILLDVEMPQMDGYQVCRTLKSQPETEDCAVIFVTGKTGMDSEIQALEAGGVDFITKPLNPPVARARVRTQLKLQHYMATLFQMANRDPLTGLFNRRYCDDQLEQAFRRHQRQQQPLGVAFIETDCFKTYNDHYGHQQGDACLKLLASALEDSLRRPGTFVARYGGDEFVIVLPYTSLQDAKEFGEIVREHIFDLCLEHRFSDAADRVTISVGVASMTPTGDCNVQQLVAQADSALFRARACGGNFVMSMDMETSHE